MGYYFLGYIATFLDIRPIWAQKQDTLERFRVKKAQSWGIKSHRIFTKKNGMPKRLLSEIPVFFARPCKELKDCDTRFTIFQLFQ